MIQGRWALRALLLLDCSIIIRGDERACFGNSSMSSALRLFTRCSSNECPGTMIAAPLSRTGFIQGIMVNHKYVFQSDIRAIDRLEQAQKISFSNTTTERQVFRKV